MPYIKQEDRERLFQPGQMPKNAGELNFCISLVIDQYWHSNGKNYQAFNDITGALVNALLEYYRRRIAYYELNKLIENGDVYRYVPEHTQDAREGQAQDASEESRSARSGGQEVPSEGDPEQAPLEGC